MSMINNIKISKLKNKDENWVAKVLKKRLMMPVYITIIIVIIVLLNALANSYLESKDIYDRNEKIKNKITKNKDRIKNLNGKIKSIQVETQYIKGVSLDSKAPITLMTKVCQMLKDKDVIGSFYIKKRNNDKFNNVLDFEIQVSYGDRDLLFMVSKLVLDKVFYLKNINQTKKGLIFELYKPSKEGKNDK